MIGTHWKPTIDTQRRKKTTKHNTKDSHHITREENKRREEKRPTENKPKTINKMEIRKDISIITLNVNGLNAPTKRYRQAEWIQK